MEERHVAKAEVEAVLARPDIAQPAKEGRQAAWASVDGRSIMVIHEPTEDGSATIVVTVISPAEEAEIVKAIQVVTSEGPRGPVYIRFSNEPISFRSRPNSRTT
jgi:hypothetical protein